MGDIHLAKALYQWIGQLDSSLSHGALIVADPETDWAVVRELYEIASKVFQRVEIITGPESVQSWPAGANCLFKSAAKFFQDRKIGPWLWLEPDAAPLGKGWLDTIQTGYFAAGKPFFGSVMQATEPNMPKHYLAGVACYPSDCWKRMGLAWDESRAFDVATASVTVPFAANTGLIQHFWGEKDLPPIFVCEKTAESPRNAFTLDRINPEAVVFHRSKDLSLLKLLGYRESQLPKISIDLVLPFWAGDARLMLKNINWMNFLHGKKDTTAVLLADVAVDAGMIQQIVQVAKSVFSDVVIHRYSSVGFSGWPNGPNRAFQEACYVMASRKGSPGWFWMEADAVPVVPDWLEQLSVEYERGGKPFAGTIIECMGWHLNGIAIYPAEVQRYCKSLMKIREAWDVALNSEITPHRHKMNHLIQHHMSPPSFASAPDLMAIEPGVVVIHPDKSGNLIDRLAERT